MEGGDGGAAGAIARRRLLTHNISFFNRGRGAKVDCAYVCVGLHTITELTLQQRRHASVSAIFRRRSLPGCCRHFQT